MGIEKCICKICGQEFNSRKDLHSHIKKEHKILISNYYIQYEPRFSLLTGEKIPYKNNYKEYLTQEFRNSKEMALWVKSKDPKVKTWMLKKLEERIKNKKLSFAPSYIELETATMPSYFDYNRVFGSYETACSQIGVTPLLGSISELKKINPKEKEICIDTREQKPLSFEKSKIIKLAFGDYTLSGDNYTYTFVDRKNESDFKGTFGKDIKRFEREMERCVSSDSFMYVVIEDTIENIKEKNKRQKWGSKSCEYPFKNMREIMHKFPRKIQFIFTKNRGNSEKIIPYLLSYGEELWDKDVYGHLKMKGFI